MDSTDGGGRREHPFHGCLQDPEKSKLWLVLITCVVEHSGATRRICGTRENTQQLALHHAADSRRSSSRPLGRAASPMFLCWENVRRDLDTACRRIERKLNP